MTDPRALGLPSYKSQATRIILNYLNQAGYPEAIQSRSFQKPTAKDFQQIFKFLYAKLDPNYELQKKIEDELLSILHGLRYPFVASISKSSLSAPSSSKNWPTYMGILHWMVELVMVSKRHYFWVDCGTPCVERMSPANPNFYSPEFQDSPTFSERIFFDYLSKAYTVFLAGRDDFDSIENDLADCFDHKNKHIIQEVSELEASNETLRLELRQLTGQVDPLVELQKKQTHCLADLEKFRQTIAVYGEKKQRLHSLLEELRAKIEDQGKTILQLKDAKVEYQQIVDVQEISPADIERMNSERQRLSENLRDLNIRVEELNKDVWQREIDIQPKIDLIEQLVQDFNTRCYKLGITSTSGPQRPFGELQFDPTAHAYEKMLSIDVKRAGRPVLAELRRKLNSNFLKIEGDRMTLAEELDTARETIQDKRDALEDLETQRLRLESKLNEEKERMNKETVAHNNEILVLERETDQMQQDNTTSVLHWQQRAQSVTMEFNRLSRHAAEKKEMANAELIKVLTDLISFKAYVEKQLSDLRMLSQHEQEAAQDLPHIEANDPAK
ncbi:HEC/Ndc80p family-domain-containing protein [Dimargaris cristalligena]|uniref:Kinetochore protein NDC80 n=1 Tax=Dimargaris cristalligena TaxID=215637 RepID=A0A4P9ZZX9_9FUNG|nr:HEC/Ndc80p family-domain-containing protein [Dimargaris cristalligena]|eukprot:RKP39008.1 HEC/Ndc80p family-domain-containing protein [Dimargaris cristalligena]